MQNRWNASTYWLFGSWNYGFSNGAKSHKSRVWVKFIGAGKITTCTASGTKVPLASYMLIYSLFICSTFENLQILNANCAEHYICVSFSSWNLLFYINSGKISFHKISSSIYIKVQAVSYWGVSFNILIFISPTAPKCSSKMEVSYILCLATFNVLITSCFWKANDGSLIPSDSLNLM